ncbi:MAG: hypothetical protein AAF518_13610 [Spirochaetota bacterium]
MGKLDKKKFRKEAQREKDFLEEKDPFHDFEGSKSELFLLRLSHFAKKNRRSILIASFAVIVGLLAFISISEYGNYRNTRSTKAIEALEETFAKNSGLSTDKKIESYKKLSSDFNSQTSKLRISKALSDLYAKKQDYKNAAEHIEEASNFIKGLPEMEAYYLYIAATYREKTKEKEKAIELYSQAVAKIKTNREIPSFKAWALFHKARLQYNIGKKKEALEILKQVLQVDTKLPSPKLYQVKKIATYLLIKINKGP